MRYLFHVDLAAEHDTKVVFFLVLGQAGPGYQDEIVEFRAPLHSFHFHVHTLWSARRGQKKMRSHWAERLDA